MPRTGMDRVAWLTAGGDSRAAAQMAAAHGLHILLVSHFAVGPRPRGGVVLGLAGNTPYGKTRDRCTVPRTLVRGLFRQQIERGARLEPGDLLLVHRVLEFDKVARAVRVAHAHHHRCTGREIAYLGEVPMLIHPNL